MNSEEQGQAPRKGGRPLGSYKDPDVELAKEKGAWLARLRKSGTLMDAILGSYQTDLTAAGLGRDAKMEIMQSLKACIEVQLKAVAECQKLVEKGAAPPAAQELDLK